MVNYEKSYLLMQRRLFLNAIEEFTTYKLSRALSTLRLDQMCNEVYTLTKKQEKQWLLKVNLTKF